MSFPQTQVSAHCDSTALPNPTMPHLGLTLNNKSLLPQRSSADRPGRARLWSASLASSSLKADSSVMLGFRMVFLFFNYFGHTACAPTHVTHRPLMTDQSEAFLQTLITFQNNIRRSPVFRRHLRVCFSSNYYMGSISAGSFANQCGSVEFGFMVRVRSRPLKHS